MEIFYTNESDFGAKFDALVHRGDMDMANVMPIVANIIAQVRKMSRLKNLINGNLMEISRLPQMR